MTKNTKLPYVVGIGASAGGLEALEVLFARCPSDSGASFVVIQHLSPDFKSLMDELLARHTEMKIYRVDEETKIQPNCIYLIPPKKNLTIRGSTLIPSDQDPSIQLRLPIDTFFNSLAEQYKERAIGVILSGTGSDGSRGCATIKENDGLVIAQDPQSSKFDGMPRSVIRLNLADKILKPDEIPDHVVRFMRYSDEKIPSIDLDQHPEKFNSIAELLQSVEGLDFSSYRSSTVTRRIERRIKINHLMNIDEYLRLLQDNPNELKELHGELLINVTRFFRDKEAFKYLRNIVIPDIVKQAQSDETIRVWVAGCSTGEEAYSIAICLMEYLELAGISKEVKIFATDVDRDAVETAAAGKYPENIHQDISPERLSKYFLKHDNTYEVRSKLRRVIIFSQHNTVKDPPFTKMHLISCRNLLIYFQVALQSRAISLFHFGLRSNGVLFLGKSEALGELSNEFIPLNPTYKVFRKLRDVKLARISEINLTGASPMVRNTPAFQGSSNHEVKPTSHYQRESKLNTVHERLLNRYVPPSVLMDENFDLLHVFGNAGRFLGFPTGRSTFNLTKLLNKDLSLALSTAVARSIKEEKDVIFKEIVYENDYGDKKAVNIKVDPIGSTGQYALKTFLVSFEEKKGNEDSQVVSEVYQLNDQSKEHISNLEDQLMTTRETLQSTIEELETTNEELQSTNEELMSSNEELQSSNEELQSVNEELHTVNSEFQSKIGELTQANQDIDFLLKSSQIATMFLDEELRIRRFNEEMQVIVNVMTQDFGRRITDITFNFGHETIVGLIEEAYRSGQQNSQEIEYRQSTYLVKAVPYESDVSSKKIKDSTRCGIVLSVMDVSSLRRVERWKRMTLDAEEFNYVVSHDLRKPIRMLANQNDEMQRFLKTNKTDTANLDIDFFDSILLRQDQTIHNFDEMLEGLLRYSRLRTRGSKFRKFGARYAIRDVLESMDEQLRDVETVVDVTSNDNVYGDHGQFKLLIEILVENAIIHGKSDHAQKILIECEGRKDSYLFTISDNGRGFVNIEPEEAMRIFRSYSANDGDSQNRLGMGLAIAKRIVDRHDGKFWIKNDLDLGAIVCFTMPAFTVK